MPPRRIVVADEYATVRRLIELALPDPGFEVHCFS